MKTTVGDLKQVIKEAFMDAKFENYANRLYDTINQLLNADLVWEEIEEQLQSLAQVAARQLGVPEQVARDACHSLYGSIDRARDRVTDVHRVAIELHNAANPVPTK